MSRGEAEREGERERERERERVPRRFHAVCPGPSVELDLMNREIMT